MNYTEIRDLALSYSDRTDSDLAPRIDGFLYMVECKINRLFEANETESKAVIPYTTDDVYEYDLPSDFHMLRYIGKITNGDEVSKIPYELINPVQISWAKQNASSGMYYTLSGGKLEIYPALAATEALLVVYQRGVSPLNATTNVTNWLSEKYPDVYVIGLLVEIHTFAKDWDSVRATKERFTEVLEETLFKDKSAKHSGNVLRTRIG